MNKPTDAEILRHDLQENDRKGKTMEEPDCKYFVGTGGGLNYCRGNEPYRCSRAKEEGLCHKD